MSNIEIKIGEKYAFNRINGEISLYKYECVAVLPDGNYVMKYQVGKDWTVCVFDKKSYDNLVHIPKPLSCSGWIIIAKYEGEVTFVDFTSDETIFETKEEAEQAWKLCAPDYNWAKDDLIDIIEIKWTNQK